MSNTAISELVAACAGFAGLAAFVALVMVPVVASYQRTWERIVAAMLSLWVLSALIAVGVVAGLGVIYYWPRVF